LFLQEARQPDELGTNMTKSFYHNPTKGKGLAATVLDAQTGVITTEEVHV
jgi:hypothetical protein